VTDEYLTNLTFQSHFGLILTDPHHFLDVMTRDISIPFWSDFNQALEKKGMAATLISIPFWSDFN